MIPKVLAYVTRDGSGGREVLVFRHRDHPDAGVQVPGGTVDAGESLESALVREVKEETGLSNLVVIGQIAKAPFHAAWRNEWQERNVFHLVTPAHLPESWTHAVTAGTEDAGLVYEFSWLGLEDAEPLLAGGQGQWLSLVRPRESFQPRRRPLIPELSELSPVRNPIRPLGVSGRCISARIASNTARN